MLEKSLHDNINTLDFSETPFPLRKLLLPLEQQTGIENSSLEPFEALIFQRFIC